MAQDQEVSKYWNRHTKEMLPFVALSATGIIGTNLVRIAGY